MDSADRTEGFVKRELESELDELVPQILTEKEGKAGLPGWSIIHSLGISFEDDGITPIVIERQAAALVKFARTNPHAFDAAAYISGILLGLEATPGRPECPFSLRCFGIFVLTGALKRPIQRGRPPISDVPLRIAKYTLCRVVTQCTDLPLTRNREPSGQPSFSACDAVAEAFVRAGKHETYARMASLCYDAAFSDLRAVAEAFGAGEEMKKPYEKT